MNPHWTAFPGFFPAYEFRFNCIRSWLKVPENGERTAGLANFPIVDIPLDDSVEHMFRGYRSPELHPLVFEPEDRVNLEDIAVMGKNDFNRWVRARAKNSRDAISNILNFS